MDSFVLLAYASFIASRTLLQWLLAWLNFTLDSEDLFCWYKQKKWFLWTMAAVQAAENHGNEWGFILYLQWGIYTSIPTWKHSQNSLGVAEALNLKIPSHERYFKWSKSVNQHKYGHNLCNETRNPVLSLLESQWKSRQQHDENFPMSEFPSVRRNK